MNLIPAMNFGLTESLKRIKLSMLSRTPINNDEGNTTGYRATLLVVEDHNKYVKRDGEVVEGPNALQTFNVQVKSPNIPEGNGVLNDVLLINPRVVSHYATSSANSTFAQINTTIMCDDIRIGDNRVQQHHQLPKKDGGK